MKSKTKAELKACFQAMLRCSFYYANEKTNTNYLYL